MTLKEITDLKEQGYTLDEIERINKILESTGKEDDPKPEDDLKPEDDPKPEDNPESDDDPEPDDDTDYKKMYEDLKEKMEKDAAGKDLSGDDEKQVEIQEAISAFFKNKFG